MKTLLLALSLATAVALAACQPSGDANTAAGTPAAQAGDAPAAGEQVSAQISGAGASFIYPLVSKWSADYKGATGKQVNYQSIGSGGGIAQIKAGTVDFGSADKPLPPEELAQAVVAKIGLTSITAKQLKEAVKTVEAEQK